MRIRALLAGAALSAVGLIGFMTAPAGAVEENLPPQGCHGVSIGFQAADAHAPEAPQALFDLYHCNA